MIRPQPIRVGDMLVPSVELVLLGVIQTAQFASTSRLYCSDSPIGQHCTQFTLPVPAGVRFNTFPLRTGIPETWSLEWSAQLLLNAFVETRHTSLDREVGHSFDDSIYTSDSGAGGQMVIYQTTSASHAIIALRQAYLLLGFQLPRATKLRAFTACIRRLTV